MIVTKTKFYNNNSFKGDGLNVVRCIIHIFDQKHTEAKLLLPSLLGFRAEGFQGIGDKKMQATTVQQGVELKMSRIYTICSIPHVLGVRI